MQFPAENARRFLFSGKLTGVEVRMYPPREQAAPDGDEAMMARLRIETLTMAASAVGPDSPLPDLRAPAGAEPPGAPDPPDDSRAYSRAAHVVGCLPYSLQDAFDRSEIERTFRVAVLENDQLRATFLLELGGRLWSLLHKPTGRELLYQPRVLHFANIGLCKCWFTGGVEWNVAVRGHAAHTCSPVFATAVRAADGSPALRLWEWDRFRDLLWQIDFLLPDDVPVLLARPRVINTRSQAVPMYWWSNIAVPEAAGHRVLVPADYAYHHDYERNIQRIPVPIRDGRDVSYPTNNRTAHDYFYDVPDGNRPWIAALDPSGRGLIQASSSRLIGRKLFVWGAGVGGQRWQRQLGGDGRGYIELQAGLARTQADYLPMGPRQAGSWLEAYALMEADAGIVHGADWPAARRHVQDRLDSILPQAYVEAMLTRAADLADRPPDEVIQRGSDWGALEQRRRLADGEEPVVSPGTPFGEPDANGPFAPWLALLTDGALPETPAGEPPGVWVTHPAWRKRLAETVADGRGDHWLAWLHLGVMAFRAGEVEAAERAWRRSLAAEPSAWAYRNLAALAEHGRRTGEAADLYLQASRLRPDLLVLQVECGRALLRADRLGDLDRWLAALPEPVRRAGRMELLTAWAACHRDDLDAAEALLDRIELEDVREGENPLTDLWFAIQAKRLAAAEGVPIDDALRQRVRRTLHPPKHLDFRMG